MSVDWILKQIYKIVHRVRGRKGHLGKKGSARTKDGILSSSRIGVDDELEIDIVEFPEGE